jgi:hypothetical protein
MFSLDKPPKKQGELFWEMLCANAGTTGACFAIRAAEQGSPPIAFVIARISAKSLDAPEVALALTGVFDLASLGS